MHLQNTSGRTFPVQKEHIEWRSKLGYAVIPLDIPGEPPLWLQVTIDQDQQIIEALVYRRIGWDSGFDKEIIYAVDCRQVYLV